MADKYDAFLDAPDTPAVKTVDKYDAFLDAPVTPDAPVQRVAPTPAPVQTPAPARAVAPQPVKPGYKPTVFEELTGSITEPLLKMGTGLIAKPVSEVAGIAAMFSDYLGGNKDGDPMGFQKSVQESLTYQPRTVLGSSKYNPLNAIPEAVGSAMSAVGTPVKQFIQGDNAADTARGVAANFIGEAVPQALGMVGVKNAPLIGKVVGKTGEVVGEVASDVSKSVAFSKEAAKQAASAADWQRASAIEAAQLAKKYGVNIDPSISNPSVSTRAATTVAGGSSKLSEGLSRSNASTWGNAYKESVGLSKDTLLDKSTFDAIRLKSSKPYSEVSKLGELDVTGLNVPSEVTVVRKGSSAAAGVREYVDSAELVRSWKKLNADARNAYSSNVRNPHPETKALADQLDMKARAVDELIQKLASERGDPGLAQRLSDARTKIAQSYVAQDATNLVTGQMDPGVIAKRMAEGEHITGTLADLGKIAGNYPGAAKTSSTLWDTAKAHVSRAGLSGSMGFALGSLVGAPFLGAALGAVAGDTVGMLTGKRILSKKYQNAEAVPVDRRMPIPEDKMLTGTQP